MVISEEEPHLCEEMENYRSDIELRSSILRISQLFTKIPEILAQLGILRRRGVIVWTSIRPKVSIPVKY